PQPGPLPHSPGVIRRRHGTWISSHRVPLPQLYWCRRAAVLALSYATAQQRGDGMCVPEVVPHRSVTLPRRYGNLKISWRGCELRGGLRGANERHPISGFDTVLGTASAFVCVQPNAKLTIDHGPMQTEAAPIHPMTS